ncbi:class II fructose-bisphosphate aldolase [Cellulosilyticum sp. I15G10I2]|uniref:class II fructose-bisphosphate aldolase n=1 Tax=Cellulosilyticum sp. I15G10I2 TaxID=1892843 RepID=UPI00085C9A04|nr:class II fructose-bisphosphate aldolase [Cellulosilyticum sp. I15G10I2]
MAIVTLADILKDAKENKYGVGMFNTVNLEMARAVIGAAEEENSPVIIALAEVHIPYGDLNTLAPIMVKFAKEAKVPVAVHLDHGMSFELILKAMQSGFTSIMYDGSTLSYEENIEKTREIVKIAHTLGISVEAELGHVGGAEGGNEDGHETYYTKIEEAGEFVQRTGIDALAVAIGTAHGEYKVKPKLDINRLRDIHNVVSAPLVLHGGSGLSDDDFRNCIENGISKVNVFTDMSIAALNAIADRPKKTSYPDLINLTMEAIKAEVASKIRLFGGSNRA